MQPSLLPRASPSSALLNYLRRQVNAQNPPCAASAIRSRRRAAPEQQQTRTLHASPRPQCRRTPVSPMHCLLAASTFTPRQAFPPACIPIEARRCQSTNAPQVQKRTFINTAQRSVVGRWIFGHQAKKDGYEYARGTNPLPMMLDDSNEALRRRLRATNEMRLRCTEFDENGDAIQVSGEFKKSELIAKYGLLPRDLRKIDSSLLPHILIRPSAILLNLLHLRVLIKHNRVLVFDAYGTTDSYNQSSFMYDIDQKLRQKESAQNGILAYEFRALEAVLLSVTNSLESEFEGVSEPVVRVLRELEEDIDRDKLRMLLIYSKRLGTFEQKARLVRDALTELLEADDDLTAMYLTEKSQGIEREEDDHTDVEMLLESYHKIADEIVQAAENLVSNIRNTEEIVKAILDANRNSLMLLDLRFTVFTVGIGAGTFVAALYGMNLKNFIEESDFGFFGVSAWCTVAGIVVCMWGLAKLRRVQRVSMWGEHGRRLVTGNTTGAANFARRADSWSDHGWEKKLMARSEESKRQQQWAKETALQRGVQQKKDLKKEQDQSNNTSSAGLEHRPKAG